MKPSGAHARVWVKLPDGSEERRWVDLQTTSRTAAKRKLAGLVAKLEAGELVAEAAVTVTAPETYKAFTTDRHAKRVTSGVVVASQEQASRERYVYPEIGNLPLARITDDDVRSVLESARDKGLGLESVHKIRALIRGDLKRAKRDKLIALNPAEDVELPDGLKKDKRPFGV